MKVIEGGFGKPTEEGEGGGTLKDACVSILETLGIDEIPYDDYNNITMVINAGGIFSLTSTRPEMNFISAELSKGTHLVNEMAFTAEEYDNAED